MPWAINGTWIDYATPENITDLGQLAAYNNTITGDMFMFGILLVIFAVFFAATYFTATRVSLQISLFIPTMIAWLLLAGGLVALWMPVLFTVGFAASMMLLWKQGGAYSGV